MYLMPNSRNTSTMRSEPYSALLLRPIPAAQISGVPLVSSATVISSVELEICEFPFAVRKVSVNREDHEGHEGGYFDSELRDLRVLRGEIVLSFLVGTTDMFFLPPQTVHRRHVVAHSLFHVISRLIVDMLPRRRNIEDAVALLAPAQIARPRPELDLMIGKQLRRGVQKVARRPGAAGADIE